MPKLSRREQEIISQIAAGHTAKEIAKALTLEYRTVQAYLAKLRKKLGARNIPHAIFLIFKANT